MGTEIVDDKRLANEFVEAINNLPVVSRLEIARDLVFRRYGSTADIPMGGRTMDADRTMGVVVDILDEVIEVVKRHPCAAALRTLDVD